MLITISRETGSGDVEVAEKVAGELGWRLVDSDFIIAIAERAGLPPEEVARHEERIPSFMERLARVTAHTFPELFAAASEPIAEFEEEKLAKITRNLVTELASEGRMVLVGRAAAAVLTHQQDVLHVRLIAAREARIKHMQEQLGLSEQEAASAVDQTDQNRGQYHQTYCNRDWADPTHYHMVLNTDRLGYDGAGRLIVGVSRARGWS